MKGKIVIIIPDNDEPGRKHARLVAELSQKAQAKSIQVVSLPNLEEKGDVADYFDKGNTMRDLLNYIKEN